MIDIKRIKKEFTNYIKRYDMSIRNIKLKYEHSFEVVKIMDKIVRSMGLTEEDKNLAITIAYLHDIGRFEQLIKIGTFNDIEYDHGENGVDLLFKRGAIKEFSIPEEYYRIIEVAIRNHNKLKIEDGLSDKELFYAKLIRDADKIDIYRVKRMYRTCEFLEMPNQVNIDDFYKHQSIKKINRTSTSDDVVCVLAFVYDLNFKESVITLKEMKYLDKYLDVIKVDNSLLDTFNKMIKEINKYMEEYDEK